MTACAHAPPAVFPAPDPAHMAQDIEKIREIAEAHRQEIEQCLRLSDPSLSWVGQATLFLPRSNSPPPEAQSRARWLSTLPTVVQSFDACIQSKAKNWGIPNQVTRPSLQLVLFLQANLSGPARSKPDLASRPLLSLQEGRVQLFLRGGILFRAQTDRGQRSEIHRCGAARERPRDNCGEVHYRHQRASPELSCLEEAFAYE